MSVFVSWQDYAACKGAPLKLFFPDANGIQGYRQAQQAILICRGCPVKTECEQYRRDTRSTYGVWAGRNHYPRPSRRRAS